VTDEDLWDEAPAPTLYGLNEGWGRYNFPPPPGTALAKGQRGYMRMTNLASAFSDQKRLQDWLIWKTMMGLRAHDGLLVDEWLAANVDSMADEDQRATALAHAELARETAGAGAGARRGTARHLMMDTYLTTGARVGTRGMRMQLDSALEALDRADLDIIRTEYRVWHPLAGGVVGTSDAKVLCRRTGQVGTLDWKTQRTFWTFQEIAGQLYGYDSAPWRWEGPLDTTGGWVPNEVGTLMGHPGGEYAGRPVALVAHMPHTPGPDQPLLPVEILEVPLDYGKAVLETAARNVELRSLGKSQAVGRRCGALRPVG